MVMAMVMATVKSKNRALNFDSNRNHLSALVPISEAISGYVFAFKRWFITIFVISVRIQQLL